MQMQFFLCYSVFFAKDEAFLFVSAVRKQNRERETEKQKKEAKKRKR